jgi:hypothetical protein
LFDILKKPEEDEPLPVAFAKHSQSSHRYILFPGRYRHSYKLMVEKLPLRKCIFCLVPFFSFLLVLNKIDNAKLPRHRGVVVTV